MACQQPAFGPQGRFLGQRVAQRGPNPSSVGADLVQTQTAAFATWMIGHVVLAAHMRAERQPLLATNPLANRPFLIWAACAVGPVMVASLVPRLQHQLHLSVPTQEVWCLRGGNPRSGPPGLALPPLMRRRGARWRDLELQRSAERVRCVHSRTPDRTAREPGARPPFAPRWIEYVSRPSAPRARPTVWADNRVRARTSTSPIGSPGGIVKLNIHEILTRLPHRHPFLLVDRVVKLEKGKRIEAIKNVTLNEGFFQGHFPHRPMMPGVLMLEALAQAAGLLAILTFGEVADNKAMYYFGGIGAARFKRPVEPGDQLVLDVALLRWKAGVFKFRASGHVEGQLAVEAELVCTRTVVA